MTLGLTAGLAAAVLFGVAAVVQAHAVRSTEEAVHHLPTFLRVAVRDPLIWLVVSAYLAGFLLHAVAIWLLPLYLAQAAIAFSLPVTALSAIWVHERVTPRQWIAVFAVAVGLVLLALGAGEPGEVTVAGGFVAALVCGLGLLLLLGARSAGARSGVVFGVLSGLAYAGSAIAVRGVTLPLEPLVVMAALTVPAYGLLGFWLYSTGLERAEVSAVTAPLVVGQTVVPALIGVLLLGDGIRTGWLPDVVVGLALATAGAAAVGRTSATPPHVEIAPTAPGAQP